MKADSGLPGHNHVSHPSGRLSKGNNVHQGYELPRTFGTPNETTVTELKLELAASHPQTYARIHIFITQKCAVKRHPGFRQCIVFGFRQGEKFSINHHEAFVPPYETLMTELQLELESSVSPARWRTNHDQWSGGSGRGKTSMISPQWVSYQLSLPFSARGCLSTSSCLPRATIR